jgi:MFS family permease
MLFVGILFGMIFIIPLSDSLGRRPLLIINAALGTFAQACFFIYSDLYVYYFLMFLMGVAAALNPCVGYVYIMEI